ncbi:N5-glutamine S-adenosyl-L-methionine-dependent methyltransferase [Defluviimonas sp. 20V17]|uniref:Release factor glutamine methyltransferase n=1 Tax=Allgaiera indica TaxID=765699 RepID=A0AAN4UUF2_9RHOB|nr:peptide chain release factor N(5)-glutamine methyltransferase [Allgaiera indica]KDB05201.1 N5-glutamine S-adenosyl-L-methionine-dependent methyltransferase [Defluviimonas sp. 20V17]GHE05322.1 release factor glutamine methyltransferase [Allgaiera indica]SDX63294.1 [protein release factor]-glutamine N5-methyltransferase [Allgaiera indica]
MSTRTAAQALREANEILTLAGVADPARDSRRLLAHAMDLPPDRLSLHLPDPLSPRAAARFALMIEARAARQPVSQILGTRLFWGHAFRVTPDVLDPRPETEVLVAEALAAPFTRVVDLGTGSGAILAALLAERPKATGLGTDLSAPALEVAAANAAALGVAERAAFLRADWLDGVTGQFDLIVSNPPYIADEEMEALAPEVRDWEPWLALTPGGDGLDSYRSITSAAPERLLPGGRLIVEIGASQGSAVARMFENAGLAGVAVLRDLDGRDRVVRGEKP